MRAAEKQKEKNRRRSRVYKQATPPGFGTSRAKQNLSMPVSNVGNDKGFPTCCIAGLPACGCSSGGAINSPAVPALPDFAFSAFQFSAFPTVLYYFMAFGRSF